VLEARLTVANFVHRRQLVIEWAQCGGAGIVFNACFFEIFDAGSWAQLAAALGVRRHALAPRSTSSARRW